MENYIGKVAVVTGAGSGIGRAVAKKLMEYDLRIAGLDINEDDLKKLSNELQRRDDLLGTFVPYKCDVSKKDDVVRTFRRIRDEVGSVAITVNCAGVLIRRTLLDSDDDDITKTMDVNVKGLLLCARETMKLMIDNNELGHIININSVNGHFIRARKNISTTMVYAASKHGVTVLTTGLRREISDRKLKIKCTSISPGHVNTVLARQCPEGDPGPLYALRPEDVANACITALNTPPNVTKMITYVMDGKPGTPV